MNLSQTVSHSSVSLNPDSWFFCRELLMCKEKNNCCSIPVTSGFKGFCLAESNGAETTQVLQGYRDHIFQHLFKKKKSHFQHLSCLLLLEPCREISWQASTSSHMTGSSVLSAITPNRCFPWVEMMSFGCQESRGMTSHQDMTLEWPCRQNLSVLQPLTEEWPYAEVAGLWFLQCYGGETCESKLGKPLGCSDWTSLGWGAPGHVQFYSIYCNCTQHRELLLTRTNVGGFSPLLCTLTFW